MHAIVAGVNDTLGAQLAEAFGTVLRRSVRARLYAGLTRDLDDAVDEATYPVISGLARFGPSSAAQLADEIGIDRSVVSRHASRLQRAALLDRIPDPTDGRATLLVLTAAARNWSP